MDKTIDVTAMGELLIDFTQDGSVTAGNPVFVANPGGAPANVLAMLRKYGKKCAFIGKVGNDSFGDLLMEALIETGTDTSGLLRDNKVPTTLAFVHLSPDGERDFSFYRSPGADIMLREEEIPTELIEHCRIFHFGSLSLTDEPCRSATYHAVNIAKKAGAVISFDPNLRPPLWKDEETARKMILWGLSMSDVVKFSDDELIFITGENDIDTGVKILLTRFSQIKLLCITAGSAGSYVYYQDRKVHEQAFLLGGTVDTTGAGDIFCASVLNYVLDHDLTSLREEDLKNMLLFSNAAAYLVTTKKGVIRSVPEISEINRIIQANHD
jgi:fructokinase